MLMVRSRGKTDISLSPFVPEKLVSRDGFGRLFPRQPAAHSPHSRLNMVFTGFFPISAAASTYLFKTAIRRVRPEFID